jgi:hypothetical protein
LVAPLSPSFPLYVLESAFAPLQVPCGAAPVARGTPSIVDSGLPRLWLFPRSCAPAFVTHTVPPCERALPGFCKRADIRPERARAGDAHRGVRPAGGGGPPQPAIRCGACGHCQPRGRSRRRCGDGRWRRRRAGGAAAVRSGVVCDIRLHDASGVRFVPECLWFGSFVSPEALSSCRGRSARMWQL